MEKRKIKIILFTLAIIILLLQQCSGDKVEKEKGFIDENSKESAVLTKNGEKVLKENLKSDEKEGKEKKVGTVLVSKETAKNKESLVIDNGETEEIIDAVLMDNTETEEIIGVVLGDEETVISEEELERNIEETEEIVSITSEDAEKDKKIKEDEKEKRLRFEDIIFNEELDVLYDQKLACRSCENDVTDNRGKILASIDPIRTNPKLDIVGKKDLGDLTFSFFVYSNYLEYIDKGDIRIYMDSKGREEIGIVKIDELNLQRKYEITLDKQYSQLDKIYYRLYVTDKKGREDYTEIKEIDLTSNKAFIDDKALMETIFDKSSLKAHNIPIDFYKVRFYGMGFQNDEKIMLGEDEILVDEAGNFIHEAHYFPGDYNFEFKIYEVKEYKLEKKKIVRTPEEIQNGTDDVVVGEEEYEEIKDQEYITDDGVYVKIENETRTEEKYLYTYPVPMTIDKNYYFIVGIADIKIGRNRVTQNSDLLSMNSEYDEGMFDDGRLAFYTRNRIGKYSITAQLDTDHQELKHIFDGLGRRDHRELFKELSTEDKGYTFGDESSSMMDVDTQGQFYLRLEWDKNKALWGNYSASIDNGEYLSYSKGLYGAQFIGVSQETTSFGDDKYSGTLFFSNPETLSEYNIFLATGGSLYVLKNKDIVEGSESVTIEVINQKTGQVVKEESLSEGQDYTINNIQGRIILNNPLLQYGYKELGDIIKDNPISDYKTYLKVQYEYYDSNALYSSDYSTGGNIKYWLNDNFQIGTAYVKSTELEEDYQMLGLNGVIRKTESTYLEWEIAKSEGQKVGRGAYSYNGGLSFSNINYMDKDEDENINNKGTAYRLKGVLSLNDISKKFTEGSMAEIWYANKDGGFSIDSLDDGSDEVEYGLKTDYIVNDKLILRTQFSVAESKDEEGEKQKQEEISAEADYTVNEKLSVGVAIRKSDNASDSYGSSSIIDTGNSSSSDFVNSSFDSDDEGESIDLGVRANYKFSDVTTGYVGLQKALSTDKVDANDIMASIGGETVLFDKVKLSGEYSPGNTDTATDIQLAYAFSESYETYLNLSQDTSNGEKSNGITFGQKLLVGEKYEIFQENQLDKDSDSNEELTQLYGININMNKEIKVGVTYEQGDLSERDGKSKRNAVSTTLYYDDKKRMKTTNRLEMRTDKASEDHTVEWLTANDLLYKYNEEWTLVGKLDYSITEDKINGGYDRKFMELGIGGAYRPIWNDRLNMLWKYSYIYDLSTPDSDSDYNFGDFDERSNIFSIDAIYSLTKKLDIGGKWAYKKAEMKAAADEDEWFSATTSLYAVKLSYNFYKNWRIMGEYHWLVSKEDNEVREGLLAGLDYDIHKNLTIGIGYNFTKFSDDLRYDNYNASGIFINIVGKL